MGREDPLKEGMATHSSILAWRIPWTEEPGGATALQVTVVGHNLATKPTNQSGEKEVVKYLLSSYIFPTMKTLIVPFETYYSLNSYSYHKTEDCGYIFQINYIRIEFL